MISFPGPASALVTLPISPDADAVVRVLQLERGARELAGVRETIPAFNRLLVEGRPETWDPPEIQAALQRLAETCLAGPVARPTPSTVRLPVCYEPELAPDLLAIAEEKNLSVDEVARLHSATTYTVLATGFAPGFAYLGDLDPRLAVPRRASPRRRVEIGGVGIADRRTGVYPTAGPGGWRLIGRVPPARFADATERISRFEPGGRIDFRRIELSDYRAEAR